MVFAQQPVPRSRSSYFKPASKRSYFQPPASTGPPTDPDLLFLGLDDFPTAGKKNEKTEDHSAREPHEDDHSQADCGPYPCPRPPSFALIIVDGLARNGAPS